MLRSGAGRLGAIPRLAKGDKFSSFFAAGVVVFRVFVVNEEKLSPSACRRFVRLALRLILCTDALHEFILSEAGLVAWVPGSFPWGDRLASSQHRGTIHVPRAGVPSCTFGSAARAE